MNHLCYNVDTKNELDKTAILSNSNQVTFNGGKSKMSAENYKVCSKCNQSKQFELFGKDVRRIYGLRSECKDCFLQLKKKWRNSEKGKESLRMENARYCAKRLNISVEDYSLKQQLREVQRIAKESKLIIKKCVSKRCPLISANPKIYNLINREINNLKSRIYYHKNLEKARQKVRNYKHANRQKKFDQQKRREDRKIGKVSEQEWLEIKDFFNNSCAYCQTKSACLTQDHFIPLSKGGQHCADNIVPSCQSCNSSKGSRNYLIWMTSLQGTLPGFKM